MKSRTMESRTMESRTMESRTMESKTMESRTMESKTMESRTMESKTMESKKRISKLIMPALALFTSGCNIKTVPSGKPEVKPPDANGAKLVAYEKSCRGKTRVERYDDKNALLTFRSDTTGEYLADARILEDIQKVFIENEMYKWVNQNLEKTKVADGEYCSYHFYFDNHTEVRFGSYCFPEEYENKLAQFSEVFTSYRKDWKPLPRLVTPSFFKDEPYNPNAKPIEDRYVPCEGGVGIFVRDYVKNELFFTIVNNINKDIEYTFSPVIKNTKDNSIVYSSEKQSRTMSRTSRSRETVKLDKWLEAGTYELSIGDYSCTFEIE